MDKSILKDKDWLFNQYIVQLKTTTQIGKEVGCGNCLVGTWLRRHNIKARKASSAQLKHNNLEFCDELWLRKQYIEEGLSTQEIGNILRISNVTVRKLLKTHKIPMRSLKEARKNLLQKNPITGCNHPNWKGGIATTNHAIRNSMPYKEWRSAVLQRDKYICRNCDCNEHVHVHHVVEFANIIKQYSILTVENAYSCTDLWNIENGIVLCENCHLKIHNKVIP